MLEVEDLTVRYGSVVALRDVSLTVEEGEVVTLLGANGAGKSSLLSAIVGLVAPAGGAIRFEGRSLLGRRPEHTAREGVALVPEGRYVFSKLTVLENLRMGLTVIRARNGRRSRHRGEFDRVLGLFPQLEPLLPMPAGRLSGGEQQQLAIARALLGEPRLLLLDEPSLGLAPVVTDRVFESLRTLREQGSTILLVEQSVGRALKLADRAYVFRTGSVEMSGAADDIAQEPAVTAAYMGS